MKHSKRSRLWALSILASLPFIFFAGCTASGEDEDPPKLFKLSYDADSGTGTVPQEQRGVTITVASGTGLTKGDSAFKSWKTDTGKGYAPGSKIKLEADTVLYALYDGNGTDGNPYLISSAEDLRNIETGDAQACYKVANDFVISGDWTTLDIEFAGEIDGAGNTITFDNVTMKKITGDYEAAYCALIKEIGEDGVIKNLVFDGGVNIDFSEVDENDILAGGLVVSNCGLIQNCGIKTSYTIESPKGFAFGAYCGSAYGGTISGSFVSGDINITFTGSQSNIKCGGFIGAYAAITIENCYSESNITVTDENGGLSVHLGGIIGHSDGYDNSITACYATGNIKGIDVGYSEICGIRGAGGNGSGDGISDSAALNGELTGVEENDSASHRISLYDAGSNCYGRTDMAGGTWDSDADGLDGTDVTLAETQVESWWNSSSGINWSGRFGSGDAAPWKWDAAKKRPVLYWQ
jgi:hypothetical protein